jgi:hypothetical protein
LAQAEEITAKVAKELMLLESTASHRSAPTPSPALISDVGEFLSILVFDIGRAHRDHIAAAAPALYSSPIVIAMGHEDHLGLVVWETVHGLFRIRMRGRGPITGGALAKLRDLSADLPTAETIRRGLQPKTVSATEIIEAVRFAITCPPLPSRRAAQTQYTTRLAMRTDLNRTR